jgi:transcriptional regulator with XRE-family HTH domain
MLIMEDILATWITKKTEEHGWSLRELGRRAEISHATISNIVSGKSKPTFEFCLGIAKAFGEQPERVFRMAGLLTPEPGPGKGEDQLIAAFRQLSPQQQQFLIASARGLQGKPASGPSQDQQGEQLNLPPVPAVPEDEHIMELFQLLDVYRRREVYNYTRWQLKEQLYPFNSSGRQSRQEYIQAELEKFNLYLNLNEPTTPAEIQRLIADLQLHYETMTVDKEKFDNNPTPAAD